MVLTSNPIMDNTPEQLWNSFSVNNLKLGIFFSAQHYFNI